MPKIVIFTAYLISKLQL